MLRAGANSSTGLRSVIFPEPARTAQRELGTAKARRTAFFFSSLAAPLSLGASLFLCFGSAACAGNTGEVSVRSQPSAKPAAVVISGASRRMCTRQILVAHHNTGQVP